MPQVSLTEFIQGAKTGLISFPTDTVPALAAHPSQAHLIFEAKQRSLNKPLILMGARASDLWPFVKGSESDLLYWQEVAHQHWPGALTMVLPASDRLPQGLNPNDPTSIGIRVPNSAIARHILSKTGPLATTSANLSGEPALQRMDDIEAAFPAVLTLEPAVMQELGYVAEAPTSSGTPSTVAQWTGSGWHILRQGSVSL